MKTIGFFSLSRNRNRITAAKRPEKIRKYTERARHSLQYNGAAPSTLVRGTIATHRHGDTRRTVRPRGVPVAVAGPSRAAAVVTPTRPALPRKHVVYIGAKRCVAHPLPATATRWRLGPDRQNIIFGSAGSTIGVFKRRKRANE